MDGPIGDPIRRLLHNMKPQLASIRLTCYNSEVYEPSDDSFALVDALVSISERWPSSSRPPRLGLEIGSGSGYVVCSLALLLKQLGLAAQLFATDVNASASAATRETLRAHQVTSVDVVLTDLASALQPRLEGLVDLLLFNPPYVPTPEEEVGSRSIAAAWAGGNRGRQVIDRVLPLVPKLLSPDGEMLMVTVHDNDPDDLLQIMAGLGFDGRVALTRAADEEQLKILYFWRQPVPH